MNCFVARSAFGRVANPLKTVLLVYVFSISAVTAQVSTVMQYTNLLPPAPSVSSLANISRTDVGMFTGTARFDVPVTSFKIGDLTVPVSLHYSSNGVKVDQIASRAGIDFQIEAGGVVTRTVKGFGDDEHYRFVPPPDNSTSTSMSIAYTEWLENLNGRGNRSHEPIDSQPDLYYVTAPGLSFNFLLDSNKVAVPFPKSNVKIETHFADNNGYNILVTDGKGTKYYFGGAGAIETSLDLSSCSRPSPMGTAKATAFHLTKIKLYTGDSVTFQYTPVHQFNYDVGQNEMQYYQNRTQSQDDATTIGNQCHCDYLDDSRCINFLQVSSTKLLSIEGSNNFKIFLSYQPRKDCDDELLNIVTLSYAGNKIEKYQLKYRTAVSSVPLPFPATLLTYRLPNADQVRYRYFLSNVFRLSTTDTDVIKLYSFDYIQPDSVPIRLSYQQDHYGYYNGYGFNKTMVPRPSDPSDVHLFPSATANRDPDTVACKFGLLSRIGYPTGGFDSVDYSINRVYTAKTIYPGSPITIRTPELLVTGSGFDTEESSTSDVFGIDFAQWVRFGVVVSIQGEDDSVIVTHHPYGRIELLTPSGSPVPGGSASGLPGGSGGAGIPYRDSVFVNVGSYKIRVTAAGAIAGATGDFTYQPGSLHDVYADYAIGGSRVRRIRSYSNDNSLVDVHRYFYHDVNSSQSSGVKQYEAIYIQTLEQKKWCTVHYGPADGDGSHSECESRDCNYLTRSSNSLTNLFPASGSPVAYAAVIEKTGPDNEAGMTLHKFLIQLDVVGELKVGNNIYWPTLSNVSVANNGKETETTQHLNAGANTDGQTIWKPIKQTKYHYSIAQDNYDEYWGAVVSFRTGGCNGSTDGHIPVPEQVYGGYESTHYLVLSPWNVLDSTTTTDFTPDGQFLKVSSQYFYDSLNLLTSETVTRDSRNNVLDSKNYYSSGLTVPGVTPDQTTLLSTLNSSHHINEELVYQHSTRNGGFMGSYRNELGTTPESLILSKNIHHQVVENTDASLFTFNNYDSRGNVLERTKNDGVLESYIWDYKQSLPIAKVIGAGSGEIAFTGFEGDGNGNWTKGGTITIQATGGATGSKYATFSSGATISKTGLTSSSTYVISYWYKSGASVSVSGAVGLKTRTGRNGWTFARMKISGVTNITINVSGAVDDMALYPANADVTFMTHRPGVGVDCVSDSNGNITSYEYDGFNRLSAVRDMDGNLLTTQLYNYAVDIE